MDHIYVSADGDGIGGLVEVKVLQNDIEGIKKQSATIKKGQRYLKRVFKDMFAGEVLVYGGDDVLFRIDAKHLYKLERIRRGYQEVTGFTITMGVGLTMKDAVRAMVYGKLTGKDRLVAWSDRVANKLNVISGASQKNEVEKMRDHGLLTKTYRQKPFAHGWVDPEGKYHELERHQWHERFITGKVPSINEDEAAQKKLDQHYRAGWVSLGHGGGNNVKAHRKIIDNPDHPAMKTVRRLAGRAEEGTQLFITDDAERQHSYVDARHFARHGTVPRKGSIAALRAELE